MGRINRRNRSSLKWFVLFLISTTLLVTLPQSPRVETKSQAHEVISKASFGFNVTLADFFRALGPALGEVVGYMSSAQGQVPSGQIDSREILAVPSWLTSNIFRGSIGYNLTIYNPYVLEAAIEDPVGSGNTFYPGSPAQLALGVQPTGLCSTCLGEYGYLQFKSWVSADFGFTIPDQNGGQRISFYTYGRNFEFERTFRPGISVPPSVTTNYSKVYPPSNSGAGEFYPPYSEPLSFGGFFLVPIQVHVSVRVRTSLRSKRPFGW